MQGQSFDLVSAAVLLLGLSAVPFLAVMVTSYTKMVVVFGLLRSALGVPQVPSNLVLNGIAIVLTLYVMAPVGSLAMRAIEAEGLLGSNARGVEQVRKGIAAVERPMKDFLRKHSNDRTRDFFATTASRLWPRDQVASLNPDDFVLLAPAFTVSQLSEAFQLGFLLYMVFVVVDLVVGIVLLALGMNMVSPTIISVPFKLLLFIALDGWLLLTEKLVLGYQ